MAGAAKTLARWGVLGKVEAADGTMQTLSASTDGLLVIENPSVVTDWLNKGERGHPTLKNLNKSGRFHTTSFVMEPAGFGAAYSASNLPNLAVLARVCGLAMAVDTSAANEKVTFMPEAPGSIVSGSFEVYSRGQKYALTGAHGQFSYEATLGGIPRFMADLSAISNALPSDAAVPAVTYAGSQVIDPAKAEAMALTIGAWSPLRVNSMKLSQDRGINARYYDQVNGRHGGFQPSAEPTYTLELEVEAEALASYNPYQVADLATSAAFAATIGGGTNYRKHTFAAATLQLDAVPEQDSNNVATWNLTYAVKPSTPFGVDHFSWAFVK